MNEHIRKLSDETSIAMIKPIISVTDLVPQISKISITTDKTEPLPIKKLHSKTRQKSVDFDEKV